jgi:hypothetical protein
MESRRRHAVVSGEVGQVLFFDLRISREILAAIRPISMIMAQDGDRFERGLCGPEAVHARRDGLPGATICLLP